MWPPPPPAVAEGGSSSSGSVQEVGKGSYADVVQQKQQLRKFEVDIMVKDGQNLVEVPEEIFEKGVPLWENFILGRFLSASPHIAKVHMIVNRIWIQNGDTTQKVDAYVVDSKMIKFRIPNAQLRNRILKRGMWTIAGVPMMVSKWSPMAEVEEVPEVKSIPLWVHLKNVPLNMYSWDGLSFITSTVGVPIRPHPDTASCSDLEKAKIFVNADLSKELPRKINFSRNGNSFLVEFSYPWLPQRCQVCEKWGHLDTVCIANQKKLSPTKLLLRKEAPVADEEVIQETVNNTTEEGKVLESNKEDEVNGITSPVLKEEKNENENVMENEDMNSVVNENQTDQVVKPVMLEFQRHP